MRPLIITENYLKQNGVISDNADMKLITPTILLVQDMHIHPLLGTDLFDEVCDQIDNNNTTALNQTLLDDYVLPALMWYVQSKVAPIFKYRFENKGVMVKNSDNSSSADLNEVQYMMDTFRQYAEEYAQRCTRYLEENSNDYPLYTLNSDGDDIQARANNYSNGFALDSDSCGCDKKRGHR